LDLLAEISQLRQINIELNATIERLLQMVHALSVENAELKSRLGLNSQNSSKPPSTDGLKKKPAFPKTKKGKKGGTKGHKGDTLKFVSNPDNTVTIPLQGVCACGCNLSNIAVHTHQSRQVFEIPEPKIVVTEYQTVEGTCRCNRVHVSQFPEGVSAHTQYGSGVKAFVTMLIVRYKIPFKKVKGLFVDLFGQSINESTINTATEICYSRLEATEAFIRRMILLAMVVNFDETGMRCNGKLHWLHNASTPHLTYLFIHTHRGKNALNSEYSIIKDFKNWAVHDCWSSYFAFKEANHAVCGAHLLRELTALIENGSFWAKHLHKFLLLLYQRKKEQLMSFTKQRVETLFDNICRLADNEEPPPEMTGKKGRHKCSKGRNLLNRLQQYKEAVLAFYFHPLVPFTNNQAERDVRPAKLKQKISGCFRTFKGAQIYARIEGFISTLTKSNINIFKELTAVFDNKNYCFNTLMC